jgi:hypothetical protein
LFMRLNPTKRVGVALVGFARVPAAYAALRRTVGNLLPDYNMRDPPQALPKEDQHRLDTSAYVGSFGNSMKKVDVSHESGGSLVLETVSERRSEFESRGRGTLVPARHDSFFVIQPNTTRMFFIQYLKSTPSGGFDLLWDITTLWKRRHVPSPLGLA